MQILALVAALYEVIIRVYPTSKDWSILSMIISLVSFIIPNKSKGGAYIIQDELGPRKRKFLGLF